MNINTRMQRTIERIMTDRAKILDEFMVAYLAASYDEFSEDREDSLTRLIQSLELVMTTSDDMKTTTFYFKIKEL